LFVVVELVLASLLEYKKVLKCLQLQC
jgi:hypothetical protein